MNYCIYTKKQNNSVILSCLLTRYLGYSSEPVSWSLVPATCQRLKQVVKECFTKANEWLSSQWIDYYQLFPHVHLKTFSTLVSWVYFSYLMAREWSQDDQPRLHWKTRYQFRLGKSFSTNRSHFSVLVSPIRYMSLPIFQAAPIFPPLGSSQQICQSN